LRPVDEEPRFTTPDGSTGTWGNQPFTNFIRNGSFETSWPRVETHLDNLSATVLPDSTRPTLILNSFLDWSATQVLYRQTYQYIAQTFWARFGWGHVPVIWPEIYSVLNWIGWIGFAGAVAGALRRWRRIPWDWIWLTVLASGLVYFADFVRGVGYFTSSKMYIPPARYAFPAVIPILIILISGWLELFMLIQAIIDRLFTRKSELQSEPAHRRPLRILAAGVFTGSLIFLCVISLVSILIYYGKTG